MVTNIKLPIMENTHSIINAEIDDLPFIYNLFEQAINFQKNNQFIGWLAYDKDFIKMDIINRLLFKVIVDNEIRGIFSICFTDELIWRDKEKGDAIYIHRVVLNRLFTGKKIFKIILEWAISFSWQKKIQFIRIDTWAANTKLIEYYKSYGFHFIENYITGNTTDLPLQHRNLHVALFEYRIQFGKMN